MGVAFLLTSFLSVGAIIQRNHVTMGLVVLNWVLIADAVMVLVVGSVIWFYTLRERAEFHTVYSNLQSSQRLAIQDQASPLWLPFPCLSNSSPTISSNAADILTQQTSLSLAEAFARPKQSPTHSTRPLRATSVLHPSRNRLILL